MTSVEAIGVHAVEAPEDVYLVELIVRDSPGPFELTAIENLDRHRAYEAPSPTQDPNDENHDEADSDQ